MKVPSRLVAFCSVVAVGLFLGALIGIQSFWRTGSASSRNVVEGPDCEESALFSEWLIADSISSIPVWLQAAGGSTEAVSAYADLQAARQTTLALREKTAALRRHMEGKDAIMSRFLSGKLCLVEAAQELRSADREFDHTKVSLVVQAFPGRTEIEKYCNRILTEMEMMKPNELRAHQDLLQRTRADLRFVHDHASFD